MKYMTPRKTGGRRYTGLLSRLLMLIGIMCVLVLLASTLFSMQFFRNMLVRSIQELEEEYLNVQAGNVESLLHTYTNRTYEMAVDKTLLQIAKQVEETGHTAELHAQARSLLLDYVSDLNYVAATLVLPDGEFILYSRLHDVSNSHYWLSSSKSEVNMQLLADLCRRAEEKGGIAVGMKPDTRPNVDARFFHMACPVYDLVSKNAYGTVVLTILTEQLDLLINPDVSTQEISAGLLLTERGEILSHYDSAFLGQQLESEAQAKAVGALPEGALLLSRGLAHLGFRLYRVVDRAMLLDRVQGFIWLQSLVIAVVVFGLFTIVAFILRRLTHSTRTLLSGIDRLAEGEINVNVQVADKHEIGQIAEAFNHMSREMMDTRRREAEHAQHALEAVNRLHLAEMKALERQIDAHFLYNTLNTINYTAIENDDEVVSRQIRHLASILRYTFEKSDGVVTAAQVLDWLVSYLSLQKLRFGKSFDFTWVIDDEVRDWPMRKLLVQPFVENAVLHGFEGRDFGGVLRIAFQRFDDERMRVTITDNGHGISKERCRELNAYFRGEISELSYTRGIGTTNAAQRMQVYYNGRAKAFFRSEQGVQTSVTLLLPRYEGSSSEETAESSLR